MTTPQVAPIAPHAYSQRLGKLLIRDQITVKEAMKQMGEGCEKILFVVDDGYRLLGTATDGDIRRWILKDGSLNEKVAEIYHKSPRTVPAQYKLELVKELMTEERIPVMPVVDSQGYLVDALFWNDIFSDKAKPKHGNLTVPVLIMAGGKGARLDPFTKILPKPLIPVGEKPIVEIVMDRFAEFGCWEFYLTVNYKGKMIQSYFENSDCSYDVRLLWEESESGTAGSLREMQSLNAEHLFVSNCDILITADYSDIFHFHETNENDITIVGSVQHHRVPYGVMEIKNGGVVQSIVEKPEYDFLVNTGLYLIRKEVIRYVPDKGIYDFTDLIKEVKNNGGMVRVYPVAQDAWMDIGQWQEYQNTLKKLESSH